jgi:hypothetical protein
MMRIIATNCCHEYDIVIVTVVTSNIAIVIERNIITPADNKGLWQ